MAFADENGQRLLRALLQGAVPDLGPPQPPQAPAPPPNPFETNPGYLAALAAEQAGSQQADAALRAAQEAAIVGYGDPSIASALGTQVNENTAAAARQNYLSGNSSLSRLDRQRDLNQQAIVNNLAAHGIERSGDLGYKTGQNAINYGNAVYDTQQQLLSGLQAASQGALQTKQGLHRDTTSALTGAYDQMVQNPQFYGAAPVTEAPTPAAPPVAKPAARMVAPPVRLRNPYVTGQKRYG